MKKNILILIGILILLIAGGVWFYLFIFGTPTSTQDVFSNFGIGDTNPTSFETPDNTLTDTELTTRALRQLTTRPVAGAVFTQNGIRYMERGTGHVYTISLRDWSESLISGTTIARVVDAAFSPQGTNVAVTTEAEGGDGTEIVVGTLDTTGTGSFIGKTLPQGAREVSWNETGTDALYILKNNTDSVGYAYTIATGTSKTLFTIPLRDITVLWGTPTYIATTPSAQTHGFLYRVSGNTLQYVTQGGNGLTAARYTDGLITSHFVEGTLASFAHSGTTTVSLPTPLIPEKCIEHKRMSGVLYCAIPTTTLTESNFPDAWYKGTVSFSDALWEVDTKQFMSKPLINFLIDSGREIDVSQIGIDPEGKYIWFINKNDDTLWMYDTTLSSNN
jgi:hypothetical protein